MNCPHWAQNSAVYATFHAHWHPQIPRLRGERDGPQHSKPRTNIRRLRFALSLTSEPTKHTKEKNIVKILYVNVECCAVGQGIVEVEGWPFECFEGRGTSVTEPRATQFPKSSLSLAHPLLFTLILS